MFKLVSVVQYKKYILFVYKINQTELNISTNQITQKELQKKKKTNLIYC